MNKVAAERQVLKQKGMPRSYSIYRDILFLAFAALERENIDQGKAHIKIMPNCINFCVCSGF
jgi:hypothetical protein